MVAVVLADAEFAVAYRAPVPLRLLLCVPHRVGARRSFRAKQLFHDGAYRRAQRAASVLKAEVGAEGSNLFCMFRLALNHHAFLADLNR